MGRKKREKKREKNLKKLSETMLPIDWLPGDFKPGSLGFHEAVDRTCLIAELFSYQVASHPAVEVHPKMKKLAGKIESQLFELYQKLSLVHAFDRGRASSSDAGLKEPVFGIPTQTPEEEAEARARARLEIEIREGEAVTKYANPGDPDRTMTRADYERIFPGISLAKVEPVTNQSGDKTSPDETSPGGTWVEFRENV